MKLKIIGGALLIAGLGGCSTGYEIRAVVIDGRVAFIPADKDWWGNPDPDCFYSISVSTRVGPPATADKGDSPGMVKNGVYWNESFAVTSCENSFPIVYGAHLKGPPFREVDQYSVSAKPLLRGVVYEVSASSNGSAYGGGKFRITQEGQVENLGL